MKGRRKVTLNTRGLGNYNVKPMPVIPCLKCPEQAVLGDRNRHVYRQQQVSGWLGLGGQ